MHTFCLQFWPPLLFFPLFGFETSAFLAISQVSTGYSNLIYFESVEKFLHCNRFGSSWRSYCVDLGSALLVLGWSSRWCRLWEQRDSTEPCNSSCCYGSLWLLLLRTRCIPEHLYFIGETKPVPCNPLNLVNKQFTYGNVTLLPLFYVTWFVVFHVAFVYVRSCMLELLSWGTQCLEKQHCRSSLSTCLTIWSPQR